MRGYLGSFFVGKLTKKTSSNDYTLASIRIFITACSGLTLYLKPSNVTIVASQSARLLNLAMKGIPSIMQYMTSASANMRVM